MRVKGFTFHCLYLCRVQLLIFMWDNCFRAAISQVRFNALPLNNNLRRYIENSDDKRCLYSKTVIENHSRFIFDCFMYKDLRSKFFKDCVSLPLYVLPRVTIVYTIYVSINFMCFFLLFYVSQITVQHSDIVSGP